VHLRSDCSAPSVEGCWERKQRSTVGFVAGMSGEKAHNADEVLLLVPSFALIVAVVAVVVDPSSTVGLVLAAVPVVAFGLWAYKPTLPLSATSVAVIVPVVVAQRSGQLEPLMFEVVLLAFVVGRWSRSTTTAVGVGLLAAAVPVAVSVIQDPSEINVGVWILGVAFPWTVGRALAHQAQLAVQLDASRRELAEQALVSERRRIARDVHDFVGHGLAAMMLQVTSARHVLRRDPAAAEEALRSAEEVGRLSMQELRRTVGLLRSDDEGAVAPPVPSASEIPALVNHARAGGLSVELRMRGDLSEVPQGVGVALYRIAQEALANAARHAPRASTILGLEVGDGQVGLVAETNGPAVTPPPAEREQPKYGLIGMRERATSLGGEFDAGATPDGWRVSCLLPLTSNGVSEGEPRTR
jgi:signal transduction histidine kinase